jgi:putative transposase
MLFTPENHDSLAKTMQKLSLTFTQHINKKYKRTGRLWECRFHSSLVDREGYLWAVCKYIERNPVRAKLVDSPSQYGWSSASDSARSDIIEHIWDKSQRREYLDFLNTPEDAYQVRNIRLNTSSGRPTGSEKFVERMARILKIDLCLRARGRPRKVKKE